MFLPYSQDELDEFVTPTGEVFYSFRSIVFDSWLTWDDALPDVFEPVSYTHLTLPTTD